MPGTLFDLIQSIRKGCIRTEEKIRIEHDLSAAEFVGIRSIQPGEKLLGGEFSRRMDLSPSRGSRVITQLVQKNIIQVQTMPDNRRSIEVSLTETGRRLQKDIEREIIHCEDALLARLPDARREVFKETLTALSRLLNDTTHPS